MPINFKTLGATENIRKRRLQVLAYHLKNGTPDEIAKKLDLPIKTVYNDIYIIDQTELHILSQVMEKDLEITALDLKHRELEGLVNFTMIKDPDTGKLTGVDFKDFNGLQTLILKNKELSLKLKGLMSDKVEHSGQLDITENINIDEKLAKEFGNWLATRKKE